MKIRQIAAMMIPFLMASQANGKNTNQQQMIIQSNSMGNKQNGYAFSSMHQKRNKKHNRITMRKRLKLKHKKAA